MSMISSNCVCGQRLSEIVFVASYRLKLCLLQSECHLGSVSSYNEDAPIKIPLAAVVQVLGHIWSKRKLLRE